MRQQHQNRRSWSFSRGTVIAVGTVMALVAVGALAWGLSQPPRLTVDFLDVGQGDAELLRIGRAEMLVDGGPDATVLSGLGESLPLLDRHLEAVVLTHAHADHLVGLIHVLGRYEVDVLYYTGAGATPEWKALVATAKARSVPMKKLAAGQQLALGDRRVDVLWPPAGYKPPKDDENYRSAVLCVQPEKVSDAFAVGCDILLTGDAPTEVEDRLVAEGAVPRAAVLKVGHHGSRTSTSSKFLAAARPSIAVVSVGKNSYGHPAWAALNRLKKASARVLRTDQDGHVRLKFEEQSPTAITGLRAAWPPLR
jgi:competence protein ComEC